jgi:hypothetical protein
MEKQDAIAMTEKWIAGIAEARDILIELPDIPAETILVIGKCITFKHRDLREYRYAGEVLARLGWKPFGDPEVYGLYDIGYDLYKNGSDTIIKLGLPLPLFWKVNHERHE